jgi:ribosomal protein S18 acetylase RimI-like enzyme
VSVNIDALADEVHAAATAPARSGARSERRAYGEIITNPNYPAVFFLHAIYELRAPDWDAARLERVIDEAIPYATEYRAYSRDPATRAGLGPRLIAAGYAARHDALMAQLFEPPSAAESPLRIEPVKGARTWRDFESLVRTDWANTEARAVDQLLAFYRWSLANAPRRFYIAYEGDRAVAHAGLHQHGFTGYLHALFTRPEARRRGAGSTLTVRLAEEARLAGCERVVLHCDRDSPLPAYYERLGFRTVGEETVWSKPR